MSSFPRARFVGEKVSLVPFELTKRARSLIEGSYDTPLAGCETVEEFLEYLQKESAVWFLEVDGETAGVFSLGKPAGENYFETTTLLFKNHRGTGLNLLFKRTLAEALRVKETPLVATVRPWNSASLRAMKKAFPEIRPLHVEIPLSAGKHAGTVEPAILYDLSKCLKRSVDERFQEVYETLTLWADSISSS